MVRHPPAFNPEEHRAIRSDESHARKSSQITLSALYIKGQGAHLEPLLMRILSLMVNVQ